MKRFTEKRLYFLFAAVVWIYLLVRAIYVPILHDEAATFFHYVLSGRFIPYFSNCESNNHVLNTLLSFFSYHLFGLSKFSLRLPNLLFAVVFFVFLYKISFQLKSKVLRWLFILSLAGSHYFMEFFCICRGYGISMALMLGSLWYLWLVFKHGKTRYYLLSLILMFLAVSANLTLINTLLIAIGLLLVHFVIHFRTFTAKDRILKILVMLMAGIIPAFFSVVYLFLLKEKGALYYGTTRGFWEVSVKTLVKALTGSGSPVFLWICALLFVFVAVTYIAAAAKSKKISFIADENYLFHLFLFGNIAATLIISKILKTNYPEDRVGLYFFPFLLGSVFFSLDNLSLKRKFIWMPYLVLLFFPLHFILNINLTHNSFFKTDRIPYSFFYKVQKYHKAGEQPPTIAGNYMRMLCWTFMNFENGGMEGRIQDTDFPQGEADFQIVKTTEFPYFSRLYDVIDEDKVSGKYLLKRKQFP